MIVVRKLSGKPTLEFNFSKSLREKPLKYKVKFQEENKKLRISKIIYSKGLIQPKKFKKKLRNQKLFLSIDKETQKIANELEEMLFNLNLKFEWIQLCRFCLIDGRISPLKERISYDDEDICFRCAKKEVMRELRYKGISANLDVILRKKKNVREVLKILDPRMSLDEGQTLFDEIPAELDIKEVEVEELEIPDKFKKILRKRIKGFQPVQILALENGILDGESMFVSSATASGKTLVGELGGISQVFKGKKFLFLVPLVALANQKYEEFKKNYPFRVAIRVGMSRIKVREELMVEDTDLDADVIVGTYEGVDFVLRSSRDLGDVGCVVIDEIHALSDPERGPRLDSLISRLRVLYPKAQIIGLSATIGNPLRLGGDMGLKVLSYDKRPVPLERYLIFNPLKREVLFQILKREWSQISKFGYRGQSIVFTNARRRCEYLAKYLCSKGLSVAAYHAGLPHHRRKKIEMDFKNQKLSAVVTTAALSQGVDFPSSCVIFESLGMGAYPLTSCEFHQMLGRAGRPNYHTKGKVYLLVDSFSQFQNLSEDEIARQLLQNEPEEVEIEYSKEQEVESLLASRASYIDLESLNKHSLWHIPHEIERILEDLKLTRNGEITEYGRAVSMSFLSIEEAELVRKNLDKSIQEVVLEMERFENVYITSRLKNELKLKADSLFSGQVLEVFYDFKKYAPRMSKSSYENFLNLMLEFFSCKCRDFPYCKHPKLAISKKILELRIEGLSPNRISSYFRKNHKLILYSGDVFSYLNSVIHRIEAVQRIAFVFKRKDVLREALDLKRGIEG